MIWENRSRFFFLSSRINRMEPLFSSLSEFGVIGAILALLFYDVFYLQKKIITIIENNTKAMTENSTATVELQKVITQCQTTHK